MKDLIELRLAVVADRSGMWNALGVLECAERILAEKDARIAELIAEGDRLELACLNQGKQITYLISQLTASRAECEGLRAAKPGSWMNLAHAGFLSKAGSPPQPTAPL